MRYRGFVHSGRRFRLGYEAGYPGNGYYQIWDAHNEQLTQQFILNAEGWREAWTRFLDLEQEEAQAEELRAREASGERRRWPLRRRSRA